MAKETTTNTNMLPHNPLKTTGLFDAFKTLRGEDMKWLEFDLRCAVAYADATGAKGKHVDTLRTGLKALLDGKEAGAKAEADKKAAADKAKKDAEAKKKADAEATKKAAADKKAGANATSTPPPATEDKPATPPQQPRIRKTGRKAGTNVQTADNTPVTGEAISPQEAADELASIQ